MKFRYNKLRGFISEFILVMVLGSCHNYYMASQPNKATNTVKPVLGIKIGVALSNATINQTSTDPRTLKTSTKAGLIGGIYVDVPLGKELIFRPEADIVSKGAREKYDPYNYPIKFNYLDFPLNILYKKNYPHGHLLAGGGPVVGIPINNSYSNYALTTDFGINGLIGYELAIGFSFNLNYTYGLSNASKNKEFTSKISNRYLGITVGYTF